MDINKDEQDALEGMFFSEHDINLYIKGELNAKKLCDHLNTYILQAYRVGKDSTGINP